ncbi:MAG: AmmeMemoRadiSam system radical SAM enzyme [Anaerolineae bacterium]
MRGRMTRREFLRWAGHAGAALAVGSVLGGAAGCSTAPSPLDPTGGRTAVGADRFVREALHYLGMEETLDCTSCHQPEEPSRILYCHVSHGQDYVRCTLCPRECIISEGARGECGVRENRGGRLHTVVYGRACALNNDPIEKKPFFHFLPGSYALSLATAGCNLHCLYCQNWSISQVRPEEVQNLDLMPEDLVAYAARLGSKSIAYTYTEPVVFLEYVLGTARLARERGLRNVVISAGYIQEGPLRTLCRHVDAIKIDLKAITEEFYRKVCDATLAPVLRALQVIRESGTHLEIVHLVVPTLNDSPEEFHRLARWVVEELGPDVPLHFSRFYPMYRLTNLPPTPVETLERARSIALDEGVKFAYIGNVPGHAGENTYCPRCGLLLIQRLGYAIQKFRLEEGRCPQCGEAIPGVWA